MATMLQAQTENQLAIAVASHTNMVAFHTATAQAIAAKAGIKDSRMTTLKRHILQACTGHGDATSFTTPPVYLEMETEGATSEAFARILHQQLKPVPLTLHKTNIYVTPHLVLTIKNLSFSSNGNKTHTGCTKGITIFAVPWQSVEAMNEDAAKEEYFEALTLKSVANIRKHISSGKVEQPTTLRGLSRMFNNYCRLLDVLFGPNCSHLVHARGVQDALDKHEADLETKITPRLCLHLLWRVHYDAC